MLQACSGSVHTRMCTALPCAAATLHRVVLLCYSAYSNSFVNLAIFKPDVERSRVAAIIGKQAEELTHLFCVVRVQGWV